MKFVSTAELKNRTNELLREAERGRILVVTRRGRPVAAMRHCTEDDIEDLVLESDPRFRSAIVAAEERFRRGEGTTLDDYKRRRGLTTRSR